MDPTAPKDNPTPPKSPAGAPPPNPWSQVPEPSVPQSQTPGSIEPGQFVAVGQDSSPTVSAGPKSPPAETLPPLPENPVAENGPILGATPKPTAEPTLSDLNSLAETQPKPQSAQPPPSFSGQPNPTPYAAPPSGPQAQTPPGGASKIKQLKVVIIIVGIVALVAIIAALVWFFVLSPKSNQATKTQSGQTDVIEPSPLPKVTQGGFGDLPQSTASSQATKSATPAASLGR